MSDDERQAQSKFHPPAVAGTGVTGPIEATPATPDAEPTEPAEAPDPDERVAPDTAPDAAPDAVPAEAPASDERVAQVKAVSPSVAPPAGPPSPPRVAPPVPAEAPAPDEHAAQVKAVSPSVASPAVPRAAPPVASVATAVSPAPPSTIPPTPASAGTVWAATAVSPAPQGDAGASEADDDEADFDDDVLAPEIPVTLADRLRRLSPALVLLSIGSIGSLVFLAFAMTSHTTPVPVLLSSAVVTGLAFTVDAVVASFMTWHAGQDGEARKALLLAVVGGMSAVIAAGAFAGTLILALLLGS